MSNAAVYASAGAEALRLGDARKARELLSSAAANGNTDTSVLLGLAQACKALADQKGQIAALDRLLAAEPRNIRALILRADCFAETGDTRSASSFYLMAIRAAPPSAAIPPDVARELGRAQQMCERYAEEYKTYLRRSLTARGFDEARSSARFGQSLDIVLGKKQIYVQQPRYYYFPGLPQVQFFEHGTFPWLDDLEAATDEIRGELLEVMRDPDSFAPYVSGDPNRPRKDQVGMLADTARAQKRAAGTGSLPLPVRPFFTAATRRSHPGPQWTREHAADLPPAADRARELYLPRRKRRARMGGRQGLGV